MSESKLEAARRTGSLTNVIGAMREEQAAQQSTATPAREQVDIVDGSIRLAAHLTEQGKTGAERRQAMGAVQVGKTVTAQGVAKTLLSRAEKIARVKAWASSLTEEQRTEYITGEKYAALSENAQDVIADAFSELENDEYSTPIDASSYDFEAEPVDVDALPEDETETDESYVDPVDAAYLNGETNYYTGEESQ